MIQWSHPKVVMTCKSRWTWNPAMDTGRDVANSKVKWINRVFKKADANTWYRLAYPEKETAGANK